MFTNNPYAQAGWYNPQNPHSINGQPWNANAPHPPTFGALPSQNGSTPTKLTFEFPDVLNCAVTGPGGKTYLSIVSNNASTLISKPNGEPVARVEWQAQPLVEIRNVVGRQLVSSWLPLSADHSYRTMTVGGRAYAWVPRSGSIVLCTAGPNPPEEFARIARTSRNIVMEITSEAVHAGLFEVGVVATVLLQSGRSLA
ncbi:hypothetical protein K443DRAFT_511697 [Laccaria amethystina LaAM-08-1]|uniref:Uncharacterized protein n=1 Tax=Laccaria amethystina LaAM-08-1 TaxID=1095629 RepID=A0A0C9WU39_9AGAR|nr:hypothetical protein K443DRAFT_511697 [Laccaria amethystina LaAM-08-1]